MNKETASVQYRNFDDFLRKHKTTEKEGITHTRIGNGKDIFPGKYIIPPNELDVFYRLYYRHVFIDKNKEYLTEKQIPDGPVLIDLDFRYDVDVDSRQHSEEHIQDIINIYVDRMTYLLDIPDGTTIRAYVFEKPSINTSEISKGYVKDGIHLIFNIKMDRTLQCMLREEVLKNINDIIEDLDLKNSKEDVLDECISKGHANWQLFGSRKPNNESYEITGIYDCTIDLQDCNVHMNEVDIDSLDKYSLFVATSAQNRSASMEFPVKEEMKEKYESFKYKNVPAVKKKSVVPRFTQQGFAFDVSEITSVEILESLTQRLFDEFAIEDYYKRETHKYLMSLPAHYSDNYPTWIRCGWALRATDFRLFISWMYFSSRSTKFNFADIPGYYDMWCEMKDEGVTHRSIMYWAKEENPVEFDKIREETVDYYIRKTEKSATEWDIAMVLYQIYKDEYRCVISEKGVMWYRFVDHHWKRIDKGTTLRYNISKTLSRIYGARADEYMNKSTEIADSDTKQQENFRKISSIYADIGSNLKRTQYKQNIMKEAAEIFHEADKDFFQKLDQNRYLLCFKNGVVDFDKKCFRPGMPEDYITLCTNINYEPYKIGNQKHETIRSEITDFMEKLFPNAELRRYMWEHLASVLLGVNKNQTFNIYNGNGSNGKSKLVDLMSMILGDYKGTVPIVLVTQKRGNIGGVSPEIAKLRGVRYAVMNEPSKGDRLNDGIMKELTGEDPITGRALYQEPVTFIPQFSLVVCTNTLFDINSNDDGTWRRIRLCEFQSKFCKEPNPTEDSPYQFAIDPELSRKFDTWKGVFASLLVQKAFETDGIVRDCEMVLEASNKYRQGQDYLMEFMNEKIKKADSTSRIKVSEVMAEFKIWYQNSYGKNVPKGRELTEFLDKKLGNRKGTSWCGWCIKYDIDDEVDIEVNDEY